MARHKNIPDLVINPQKVHYHPRTRNRRYKPVKKTNPGHYRGIPLCPDPTCSQPLVRRDGFIVCSANPWHYTQEVIARGDGAKNQVPAGSVA